MSKIKIKILDNGKGLYQLKKATIGSAGFDLVAAVNKDLIINPNSSTLVPCGFSIALPKNFEAQVRPRSGLALKNMVSVLNSPGTIDSDYRGEICVILINHGKEEFNVSAGMRIAQIIFKTIPTFEIIEVKELDKTERGDGGFGSTGMR